MEQVIHQPSATIVGLAAAELILAIQKEFPQVRLVPCEPIEGEDIHLKAYLPIRLEERLAVQDRIVEIELAVQDKYGVDTVVVALPESDQA
jgi:hypothetical protein